MVITYGGKSLIKISSGDKVVAFNPYSEKDGKKTAKFGADIALVSIANKNHNAVDILTYGNKIPFVIDGPGEYEVGGVYIKGLETDRVKSTEGKKNTPGHNINTAYNILLEGVHICHLGAHKNIPIEASVKEELGEIDVLFVPVGGDEVLDSKSAYKVTTFLEPRIIIPVAYSNGSKKKDSFKSFLKEVGSEDVKAVDKLVLKKKDLEAHSGDVFVLKES
jgi:L-ascorbate metabolism protein UlaG (beta-lactamase superfamily)